LDKTDTVKVRLQSKELAAKYSGTWNCFSTILKQEKVRRISFLYGVVAAGSVRGMRAVLFVVVVVVVVICSYFS
jgi:hypothetical protein